MAAYKEQYGVQVATVTTSANPTEPPLPDCITLFDQEKFDYAWWSTLLYGFDFMSWGEPVFSAWGICQNQLPFHDRPVAGEIGNAFTGPVAHPFPDDPPIYTRTTTAGTIEVDVAAHAGSHTPDSTINQPPIPGDDSINTQQDIPVTMAAADLLANDTDPDNDAPSITGMATTSTQGGAIVSNGDDTYTYTPPAGFSGTDTFTYTISDGKGGSATGNVSITVIPVVPPVAGHTIGLYDPLASAFYLKHSNAAGKADMVYGYGPAGAGWQPVMGDWNNNGVHTPGLYNPLTGTFYLKDTHSGGKADKDFRYGPVGQAWLPLVGDWNDDGTDTVGLYNPATGTFYLKDDHSGGKATYTFRFGPIDSALIPLAGDWNGDGQDTVGLYHQHTGVFYLVNAHRGGKADLSFRYGPANAGWQPLIGDWNGDGTDTIGLCSERSQFYLRHSNTPGVADLSFRYGPADQAWQPLVGKWQ
jgi:hypothetical protein